MAVADRLRQWGLENIIANFIENGIDDMAFDLLDEDAIKEIIPTIGDRLKFLTYYRKYERQVRQAENDPAVESAVTKLKNPNPHLPTMPGEESSEEGEEDMDLDSSILKQVNVKGTSRNAEKQMPSKKPSKSEENQTPSKKPRRFDIKAILLDSEDVDGPETIARIEQEDFKVLSKADRRCIVQALVAHLIETYGKKPSSEIKEELACDLMSVFPQLSDPSGRTGYEAWFIPGKKGRPASGCLEDRLRYVRKRLLKSKSCSGAKLKESKHDDKHNDNQPTFQTLPPEEDTKSMVIYMQNKEEPRATIEEYMQKTAHLRYNFIRENSERTVGEILHEYPRLLYPGMVEQDFMMLPAGKKAHAYLFAKWKTVAGSVINYSEVTNVKHIWMKELNLNDEEVNQLTDGFIPETELWRNESWLYRTLYVPLKYYLRRKGIAFSLEDGGKALFYLAANLHLKGVTGKYYMDLKEKQSSLDSYDESTAKRLWEVSAKLVGFQTTKTV